MQLGTMNSDSEVESSSLVGAKALGSRAVHACPVDNCGKFFSRPSRLKTHLLSHSGEKPFQCDLDGCTKSYTRKAHLQRHKANEHTRENVAPLPRLSCDKCQTTFANKYSLNKHVKKAHDSSAKPAKKVKIGRQKREKVHECSECENSATFTKWTEFQKHVKECHPKSKKEYRCEICDKIFASANTYKSHLPIHSDYRSVFRCHFPTCSRWYYFQRNLTEHIKGYHESQRFPCLVGGCDARLGSRAAKIRHMRTFHEGKKPQKSNVESKMKKAIRKDKGQDKLPSAMRLLGLPFDPKLSKAINGACGQISLSPEAVADEIRASDEIKKMLPTEIQRTVATQENDYTEDENESIMNESISTIFVLPKASKDEESDDESESNEEIAVLHKEPKEMKKYDFSRFLCG